MNPDYKIVHDGKEWHLYRREDGRWHQVPGGSVRKSDVWEMYLRIVDYGEDLG